MEESLVSVERCRPGQRLRREQRYRRGLWVRPAIRSAPDYGVFLNSYCLALFSTIWWKLFRISDNQVHAGWNVGKQLFVEILVLIGYRGGIVVSNKGHKLATNAPQLSGKQSMRVEI